MATKQPRPRPRVPRTARASLHIEGSKPEVVVPKRANSDFSVPIPKPRTSCDHFLVKETDVEEDIYGDHSPEKKSNGHTSGPSDSNALLRKERERLCNILSALREEEKNVSLRIEWKKKEENGLTAGIARMKVEEEKLKASTAPLRAEGEELRASIAGLRAEEEGVRVSTEQLKTEGEGVRLSIVRQREEEEGVRLSIVQLKEEEEETRVRIERLRGEEEALNTVVTQLQRTVRDVERETSVTWDGRLREKELELQRHEDAVSDKESSNRQESLRLQRLADQLHVQKKDLDRRAFDLETYSDERGGERGGGGGGGGGGAEKAQLFERERDVLQMEEEMRRREEALASERTDFITWKKQQEQSLLQRWDQLEDAEGKVMVAGHTHHHAPLLPSSSHLRHHPFHFSHGLPPHVPSPHGHPPHGPPPHGHPPHGPPPHGPRPHGPPPHGPPPHGPRPHGFPPHGFPPHGPPFANSAAPSSPSHSPSSSLTGPQPQPMHPVASLDGGPWSKNFSPGGSNFDQGGQPFGVVGSHVNLPLSQGGLQFGLGGLPVAAGNVQVPVGPTFQGSPPFGQGGPRFGLGGLQAGWGGQYAPVVSGGNITQTGIQTFSGFNPTAAQPRPIHIPLQGQQEQQASPPAFCPNRPPPNNLDLVVPPLPPKTKGLSPSSRSDIIEHTGVAECYTPASQGVLLPPLVTPVVPPHQAKINMDEELAQLMQNGPPRIVQTEEQILSDEEYARQVARELNPMYDANDRELAFALQTNELPSLPDLSPSVEAIQTALREKEKEEEARKEQELKDHELARNLNDLGSIDPPELNDLNS